VAFGGASAGVQLFNQPLTILNIVGTRADTLTDSASCSHACAPFSAQAPGRRDRPQGATWPSSTIGPSTSRRIVPGTRTARTSG
jgi:hypothetical protein